MKRYLRCRYWIIAIVVSLSLFMGCATAPLGPMVQVMPAPGKPFEMYQKEVQECKDWAFQQIGGQAAVDKANTAAMEHTAIGTLLGTVVGALVGSASGHASGGAAIGAGAGMVVGGASGANSVGMSTAQLQRLYDNAYAQCMYSKGNQVSGARW
jgi:uncharacterized protein YcfJ